MINRSRYRSQDSAPTATPQPTTATQRNLLAHGKQDGNLVPRPSRFGYPSLSPHLYFQILVPPASLSWAFLGFHLLSLDGEDICVRGITKDMDGDPS